ncbi:MAG: phosphate ABC transporter substrate-binding protein PstS family protein [Carnobacterium inhibens]|uniref:phosphate ABC transporter substrate-binding protein PstS family protein n=1 Tax=Carnobacterium TaxID=2747 RepID=UPI000553567B|nr:MULTISPECIES: phosphate ABC transporter substrate-binding protein PstS family protein [Carnobacterium]MCM3513475.1 phosphate ABC transporter substrate-binding protein PstS family protein [Carnobacterium inhibens]MDN5372356.1 phosphate transport system substrate-binding protein [Carnobacterium sp.]
MKLKNSRLMLTLAFGFILTACGPVVEEESITAVGSSALQPLVEAAGEQYSSENIGKFINVQGGGSGTGLSQIAADAVEIGNSDIFAEEKDGIDASKLVDHRVAVVGITPIVTPGTGVTDISIEELNKIFTGKITNWSELGGNDLPITVLNRASGSGTRATFEQWVLEEGQNSIITQEQESSGTVRQIVANTPGTISYVAFSYVNDDVVALSIDGVEPKDENVKTNDWPIWSYEHMYTNGEPTGLTKDFLDYILSEEIQSTLIEALGYIPTSQMEIQRDVEGNTIPVE